MKTLGQIAHDVFYFLKPQPASGEYDGGVNEKGIIPLTNATQEKS